MGTIAVVADPKTL